MANEQNKQPGQHGQGEFHKEGQQNPSGSVNTMDKPRTNPSQNNPAQNNPPHGGAIDPKNPQDISKKDPSRGHDSTDRQDQEPSEQGDKRRAS